MDRLKLVRRSASGNVAAGVMTGNEDGARHILDTTSQALVDIGFTIPAQARAY